MSSKGILIIVAGAFIASVIVDFNPAIYGPTQHRLRMHAQETAALWAIQTVNTAQVQYRSQFGRFATSLTELGPPTSGTATAAAADLITAGLASGEQQGHLFTLTEAPTSYSISAVPKSFGSTGSRTFFSDQTLVVRENCGPEPATANSRELGSAAKQGQK